MTSPQQLDWRRHVRLKLSSSYLSHLQTAAEVEWARAQVQWVFLGIEGAIYVFIAIEWTGRFSRLLSLSVNGDGMALIPWVLILLALVAGSWAGMYILRGMRSWTRVQPLSASILHSTFEPIITHWSKEARFPTIDDWVAFEESTSRDGEARADVLRARSCWKNMRDEIEHLLVADWARVCQELTEVNTRRQRCVDGAVIPLLVFALFTFWQMIEVAPRF